MKTIFLAILGLALAHTGFTQTDEEIQYVLRKEQITIKGSTNINKFECKLDLGYVIDTLQIKVKRINGDFDFTGLNLHIPVKAFNCKYRLMTSEFRALLRAKEFPYLNLKIGSAEHEVPNKMIMYMLLQVADRSQEELLQDCYIDHAGEELILGGQHRIYLTSYDITPPRKFFGAVVVRDELDISFEVVLERQKENEPH
ncbi:MAG: hypothetical protein ABJF11_07130 [Reichenbachiella sp.]|uniref:hypothetical protein n=1 Tax=Reichenbachiella sp. TaxID=2184521 RepID=UPI0032668914